MSSSCRGFFVLDSIQVKGITVPNQIASQKNSAPPWLPYVAPIAVFLALTALEGKLPDQYIWVYLAKVVATSLVLFACRSTWKDIRFESKWIPAGIVVGLVVFFVWIGIEKTLPYPHFGERTAYNPFQSIASAGNRTLFLVARFYGLVLLVPVMEELFWRSFLLRFASNQDFESLPIGTFTWTGFFIVAGLFGFSHPEWLVAIIAAVAYGLLLRQTKSIFACVIAHLVTNLVLGVYVITRHDWRFW